MYYCILLVSLIACIDSGIGAGPLLGQQPEKKLDPKDFSIPDDVRLAECALRGSHGTFGVISETFSSWLERTGTFGKLVDA
jgi:hypothetical protein